MLSLQKTSQFKKDLKKLHKQGVEIEPLLEVVDLYLLQKKALPIEYNDHPLRGNYQNHRECHLNVRNSDWLLIYRLHKDAVILVRTGSHSELF